MKWGLPYLGPVTAGYQTRVSLRVSEDIWDKFECVPWFRGSLGCKAGAKMTNFWARFR